MNRLETALLFALILIVPIGFGSVPGFDDVGSVEGWSGFFAALGPWHLFLAMGGLLAAVVLWRAARSDTRVAFPGAMILLALGAYAVLQVLPLPMWLQSIVAPTAADHRASLGLSGWAGISWEPGTTLLEAAKIGIHVAILVAAARVACDRRMRWWVVGAVLVVAFGEAVYGLVARFLLDDTILGWNKFSGVGRLTATFIDPNHTAALMEIAFAVALALLIGRARRRRREFAEERARAGLIDVALLITVATTITAAILTQSRAAYGALVLGLFVLLWLQIGARGGKQGKATLAVLVVLALAVPMLIIFGFGSLEERFAHGVSDRGFTDIRFPAWESTLRLSLDQPFFGVGIGGYASAIHAYQSEAVPDELWYAHNDYLNLLADGGLIGLVLGLGFVLIWGRAVIRRIAGPESPGRDLAVGAIVALLSVGAHTFFEFNLQIPGVTVPLVALLGVAVARPLQAVASRPRSARVALGVTSLVVVVATVVVVWTGSQRALAAAEGRMLLAREAPEAAIAASERGDDPLGAGRAYLTLADAAERRKDDEAESRHLAAADAQFQRAARERPFRAEPWYYQGEVALRRGDAERSAEFLFLGRRFARGRGLVNLQIGKILVFIGWRYDRRDWLLEGADAMREAGALDPKLFSEGFEVATEYLLDLDDLRRAVPATPYGRAELVMKLKAAGRTDEAIEVQTALEAESTSPHASMMLAELLLEEGRAAEAKPVLHRYFDRKGYHPNSLRDVLRLYTKARALPDARDFFRDLGRGRGRDVAETFYWLAGIHRDLGEWDDALAAIDEAIERGGDNEQFLRVKRVIELSREVPPGD